jgi:hypothetical protein
VCFADARSFADARKQLTKAKLTAQVPEELPKAEPAKLKPMLALLPCYAQAQGWLSSWWS